MHPLLICVIHGYITGTFTKVLYTLKHPVLI